MAYDAEEQVLKQYKEGVAKGYFAEKPVYCMGCPLYDQPGIVQGTGPLDADVMEVGEAPGKDEVYGLTIYTADRKVDKRYMAPFIGGAGRVKKAWAKQIGHESEKAFVTNAVKCRPPRNRPPTETEIRHCSPYLASEIKRMPNLAVIVAFGATALYVTTGHQAIGSYRGLTLPGPKREDGSEVKVLPIYHPAFIMRQQQLWPLAVFDFAKVQKERTFKEIRHIEVSLNVDSDPGLVSQSILDGARRSGYASFDWEAQGIRKENGRLRLDTGYIVCFGIGFKPHHAHSLDWTPEAQSLARAIFTDPTIEKVTQNGEAFDIPYAEQRGFEFVGKTFDVLQAFHLTNVELPKNLEFITSFFHDMLPWKDHTMYKSGHQALKTGNCRDVIAATSDYLGLKEELHSYGMEDLFYNTVMPLQKVLRNMTERGLKKNEEKAFRWGVGMSMQAKQIEDKLHNVLGHSINLDSPKDLARLLYDQMGLPVQYTKDKKKGMRPTCNAAAMDALAEITENKIFQLIYQRRTLLKYKSTYCEVDADEKGLIHPIFRTAWMDPDTGKKGGGARNGRLSSANPNGQNIPEVLREMYEPDDADCVLLEADWSQIEWRIAMVESGDPTGLELLTSGVDNHTAIAAEAFGKRYEDVITEGPPEVNERHQSKFIVYGLGYGRGAADISKQLKKDMQWVNGFVSRFFKRFARYKQWRDEDEQFVLRHSYLANPFMRRRWWWTRQVTEMYNFKPSSTAADMMYITLLKLESQLPKGATLRMTVHDSVLINAQRDVAKRAAECVKDIMHAKWPIIVDASSRPEEVKKHYPQGWYCPVELHLGQNWRQVKKGNKELEKELGIA